MSKPSMPQKTFLVTIGYSVLFFAQWFISVLLVWMDGYESAGVFSLAMTISNVFTYFGSYGMRGYQVTDIDRRYSDFQYLLAKVETVLASLVFCVVFLKLQDTYTMQEKLAILLYLGYNSINSISDSMLGTLQARGKLEATGISNILRGGVCLLSFVGCFYLTKDLILALLAMMVGAGFVFLFYDTLHYGKVMERPYRNGGRDIPGSLGLWKTCFTLMLAQVLPIITTAIPRQCIRDLCGAEQLGYYSSVFTPTVIITVLTTSVVVSILPQIAKLWTGRKFGKFRNVVYGSPAVLVAFAALVCCGAWLCGKPVMKLVFGPEILNYYSLLYWAILATVCNGTVALYNGILTAIRQTRAIAFLTVFALLVTAALSLPLVGSFGIYGAAYSQIIACVSQTVLQLAVITKQIRKEIAQ